jgi:hypothetical protein
MIAGTARTVASTRGTWRSTWRTLHSRAPPGDSTLNSGQHKVAVFRIRIQMLLNPDLNPDKGFLCQIFNKYCNWIIFFYQEPSDTGMCSLTPTTDVVALQT